MEVLRYWLPNIILLMVMMILLEYLLPSSQMQRYLRLLIGLLLLVTIIQGAGHLIHREWLDSLPALSSTGAEQTVKSWQEIAASGRQIQDSYRKQALTEYEETLRQQIASLAAMYSGWRVVETRVEIEKDSNRPQVGQLYAVALTVVPPTRETGRPGNGGPEVIRTVEKVEIRVGEPVKKEGGDNIKVDSGEAERTVDRLRSFLADYYHLPPEKVTVTWREG